MKSVDGMVGTAHPTGFWRPLAIAIAGGISGATLLALYFVPAAFLLTKRGQRTGGDRISFESADYPLLERTPWVN